MKSLNFSKKENKLALDWYANEAEPNGVEFVMKTTKTKNEQKILRSSGSSGTGDNWDVRIVPSASSDTIGKVEFRLNSSVGSAGDIQNNAVTMSTDYIDNINDIP